MNVALTNLTIKKKNRYTDRYIDRQVQNSHNVISLRIKCLIWYTSDQPFQYILADMLRLTQTFLNFGHQCCSFKKRSGFDIMDSFILSHVFICETYFLASIVQPGMDVVNLSRVPATLQRPSYYVVCSSEPLRQTFPSTYVDNDVSYHSRY